MLIKRYHPDPLICLIAFVGLGVLITMLYPDSVGTRDVGATAGTVTQPYSAADTTLIETRTTTAAISTDAAI